MRSTLKIFLYTALALVLAVAGWLAWFVQDADRFKPALLAELEKGTGIHVEIRGGLAWQFMPTPWLVAEGLHATHLDRAWSAERLAVRPDFVSLVGNPRDPDRWRIEEALVRELEVEGEGGLLRAPRIGVRNVGLGEPSGLEARLVYTAPAREPLEATIDGTLLLETDRYSVRDLSLQMRDATARCDMQAMPNGRLWPPLAPLENSVLPIEFMRAYDLDGRCEIERIEYGGENFENVTVVLDNKEGATVLSVDAPDFLGGAAQLEAIVRVNSLPVTLDLSPVLLEVDSHRLAAWLGSESPIGAPVDFGGAIRMRGNTPAALAASIDADTRFSTGPGEIDGSLLTEPLSEAAELLNPGGKPTAAPAMLNYERLNGAWVVDGERHRLNVALDSLRVEARGDYRVKEDRLKLLGSIDPGDSIEQWGLPLAPALAGVRFHFRCRGSAADPRCRLDAKRTLLGAGAAEGNAVAKELVDRHVPEELRAAAHSLLDSLEAKVDAALRKNPEELIEEQVPEKYQGMARSLLDKLGEALEEKE